MLFYYFSQHISKYYSEFNFLYVQYKNYINWFQSQMYNDESNALWIVIILEKHQKYTQLIDSCQVTKQIYTVSLFILVEIVITRILFPGYEHVMFEICKILQSTLRQSLKSMEFSLISPSFSVSFYFLKKTVNGNIL